MNVNWDYYRRRRKIDLIAWKKEKEIETYSDFLEELKNLDIGPVSPMHPDLVIMGITGGPVARKILEDWKKEPDNLTELEAVVSNSIETEHVISVEKHKKSQLSKMKKADLLLICKRNNILLPSNKNTKSELIHGIMENQKGK
ncbi:MAG TPA: hypothetical protein EYG21_01030 [Nitrospinaceae bacterium]|nr:hypothetical protein [Nitrospinaceae bacterium]